eukprot:2164465-Prorocentrum_lima.AAC.1
MGTAAGSGRLPSPETGAAAFAEAPPAGRRITGGRDVCRPREDPCAEGRANPHLLHKTRVAWLS